ncbi:myelin regulatory factor [Anthonomus grandis grandis]|uniref:myelin regulatory factor n=1 Tax=Anthonomus grandis grandis TaxID=2921223 RepID=UPI0021662B83|nr:myelin regulatory factor [Anthonomus grandis grandis]
MDGLPADLTAFLGRNTDFGGIENEGIDFSQLEDFINNEGTNTQNFNFGDLQAHPAGGKLLNVIVENKRNNNGHSLPESPPDSSSEHPYSPQDGCEAPINASDSIYTNLGPIYKQLNPIDNLILSSHIVTDPGSEGLVLQDNRILVSHDVRNGTNLLNSRLLTDGLSADHNIILAENVPGSDSFARPLYDDTEEKHNMILSFPENLPRTNLDPGITLENNSLENVYTDLQSARKKRKIDPDSALVKSEPDHCPSSQLSPSEQFSGSIDEEYASSEACLSESQYQCIRFNAFQQNNWHTLCDQNLTELATPHYRVDADKGFNFSNADDAFVCQKKNHFQVTCHVQLLGDAQFVKTPEGLKKISSFHLHFYGVKHDCPTQTIRVEQSQSDRSKKPFHPVLVELVNSQVTKVTVGRLHFSETTSNNMRKKGKPNPEQRYFQLVVGLHAHTTNGNFPVVSHASQKIIVRASNPGQFESDVELCWQKGQTQDSIVHNGKVGINTDRPDESLVVHGNIKITGHIIQPSDIRAKKNIVELNTAEQLKNVQKLRVVRYEYEPALASQLSRSSDAHSDTGVIAQEVAQVLPEAVKPAGDLVLENGTSIDNFLVVNKERIFMENIGAVKELCKVTGNLETRIDQLERINRRLHKLKRGDSLKSDSTVNSSKHSHYSAHCKCSKRHVCKYCERQEAELCSNKFIQVVIVILVLIMALCLAAITTLYLLETARHKNILTSSVESVPNKHWPPASTKKPSLGHSKFHSTWTTTRPIQKSTSSLYIREDEINKIQQDSVPKAQNSRIIGSPNECQAVNQALDESYCQIYCCAPSSLGTLQHISQPSYSEKRLVNRTKGVIPPIFKEQASAQTSLEKNKIAKPFHSNDIDKQARNKRQAYDISNEASVDNDLPDDQGVLITIQGRNFSTQLNQYYLNRQFYNSFNFSYSLPISKYMPDEYINVIFRFNQLVDKKIQNCLNDVKHHECPYIPLSISSDETKRAHKVDQTTPSHYDRGQSWTFDVDMADFQSKVMTYRVGLGTFQENLCDIPENKLGVEFVVYNFHFYRDCDE